MTENQKGILRYLSARESATKSELYEISGYAYYHNWQKHFGDVLSRLVGQGYIERVKKGVYKLSKQRVRTQEVIDPSQQTLFA